MGEYRNLWAGKATLGEGPVWDERRGVLWFVDIKQRKVHCFLPVDGSLRSWPAPAQVGWVLPTAGRHLLAGLQTGLARFDPDNGTFVHVAEVEPGLPCNRLNDATTASDGTVWFGSMDDGEAEACGSFYHWDGKTVSRVAIDPVPITNGPAFSPDGHTLYYVDTAGGIVHAAALDGGGQVVSTREFARIAPEDGLPDGVTVDSAGNLWLGLWGGGRALLFSPGGEILQEMRLPAANVTKIALGGEGLKTAFATTACAGLSAAELAGQPEAGSLFAFEVEIAGIALPPARG